MQLDDNVKKIWPNFFVIGAMKCATTSLCAYLRQHPDIFVADPKDIYFFSNDKVYEYGLEWYLTRFQNVASEKLVGEGTDNYSKQYEFPAAPSRIKKYMPDSKIIYIVRNPVNQVMSTWIHLNVMNGFRVPFNQALMENKLFFDNCDYLKQISVYYRLFPKENIHVCFFEDMVDDQQVFLENCFRFLGVDDGFRVPDLNACNTKEGRYGDRLITHTLLKFPGLQNLIKKCPSSIRIGLRPLFQRRRTKNPMWNQVTIDKFVDKLSDSTCEFLTLHGKEKDYWDIENTLDKYSESL